ncbi:MAG: RagB/SusD family nutrient uptake outer membrane protein [Bacteroidales bacterium]
MKVKYQIVTLVCLMTLISGCNDFLTPDKDNVYTEKEILKDPAMAEGILLNAYAGLPGSTSFTEVATDDAVSNDNSNSYRLAANGEWKSTNNPFNVWGNSYTNIAYLNLFLSVVNKVEWSYQSEWQNEHFKARLRAEAYGLRAFYQFRILQAHSGIDENDELSGYPVVTDSMDVRSDWKNMPRVRYDQCVSRILSDLETALRDLPDLYKDASAADPDKTDKDAVYGARFTNRMNARIVQMIKTRTLLHAASPAFNPENDKTKWEAAANAAAVIIDAFGGLSALNNSRLEYYLNENCTDILWRKDYSNSRNLEADNFPPSLYGNGRINPTQNFVDAFPTIDGYPISRNPATYNANSPYLNRDPRLAKYVIYNGATFKAATINAINGPKDGINMLAGASTRTGYYLKKMMNSNVNLQPGSEVSQRHFAALMRYIEAFLIYAEAANEAWGPDGKGGHSYSAREIMAKIRQTAGITTDNYLASVVSPEDMRQLIRTERRIELSFEGFRFWDIRRWNDLVKMKEPAKGTPNGGISSFDVENRVYEDYMIYGPVPDSEVRKGLVQNMGW